MSSDYKISDDEWKNRELCSDGNCIGVIGPDGLCKECGLPGKGGPVPAGESDTASEGPADDAAGEVSPPVDAAPPDEDQSGEAATDDDGDWANRRLCPDGNCIGVIGPDGKCKECGREG